MGTRRSSDKNKKDNRPTDAAPAEREDLLRRAASVRTRFDSTRRGPAGGAGGAGGRARSK